MRLLLLTQYYYPEIGAPQTRLAEVVRELTNRGIQVEIVTSAPNYPFGRVFADYRRRVITSSHEDGVRIHRVWVYAAQGVGLRRICNYLSFAVMSVLGLSRCRRPTHIFIESPPLTTAIPGILFALMRRAHIILNVADLWPDAAIEVGALSSPPMQYAARALESWAYRRASVLNYVTPGVRESLLSKGVPAAKLLPLPNGVNMATFAPTPLPNRTPFRFLYAGTIGLNHGAEILLRAAAGCAQRGLDVELEFLGSGSDRLRLEEISKALSLTNVIFSDPVPLSLLARRIADCHAGAVSIRNLPTTRGGRPSKLFPFLASGRPVLFSGSGEAAEVVRDSGAGLAVENEIEATTAAMAQISQASASDLDKMCQASVACASGFSWAPIIDDWLSALYESGAF
jgi:colanic acid biosynthesis glycosyl transferase WcaI